MKDYNYLASELCKLGIDRKEADIYLILLKSGHCSVQKIAEKIGLSRPTVYRVLKNLQKKNLINTVQEGKRNYFIAGSPDTLLNLLQIRKRQAEEQEREFLRIINTLQDQYSFSSKENSIETFADKKRLLALDKLSNSSTQKICIFSTHSDEKLNQIFSDIQKKLGFSFQIKQLHSFEINKKSPQYIENKFFENDIADQNIIISDKVFIFEKNTIHIVKQKKVIQSYRLMFDSLWKNL